MTKKHVWIVQKTQNPAELVRCFQSKSKIENGGLSHEFLISQWDFIYILTELFLFFSSYIKKPWKLKEMLNV